MKIWWRHWLSHLQRKVVKFSPEEIATISRCCLPPPPPHRLFSSSHADLQGEGLSPLIVLRSPVVESFYSLLCQSQDFVALFLCPSPISLSISFSEQQQGRSLLFLHLHDFIVKIHMGYDSGEPEQDKVSYKLSNKQPFLTFFSGSPIFSPNNHHWIGLAAKHLLHLMSGLGVVVRPIVP